MFGFGSKLELWEVGYFPETFGISPTFGSGEIHHFREEKREKKIFRKQAAAAAAPSLWTLTPNYSARERRGSEQVDILDISGGKQSKRNREKQRKETKEKKSNKRIRQKGRRKFRPRPARECIHDRAANDSDHQFRSSPLEVRRTDPLRVIMHHFGPFRERTLGRPAFLPSFNAKNR